MSGENNGYDGGYYDRVISMFGNISWLKLFRFIRYATERKRCDCPGRDTEHDRWNGDTYPVALDLEESLTLSSTSHIVLFRMDNFSAIF